YGIETGRLDSASMRLSWNPGKDWALQVSRGRIRSPEQLEPEVNVTRTTASAIYNTTLAGSRWQTTLAWGRNAASPGTSTDAWLLESAITVAKAHTFFGRAERADKNELFPDEASAHHHEKFTVGKLSLGYIYDVPLGHHLKVGVGGLA